jgi:hypothetical protein
MRAQPVPGLRFAGGDGAAYESVMTVYIGYAPKDRADAEALEKVIERRGLFVELDDGQTALPPVEGKDVLVLIVSRALDLATARLRLEQRALDAWSQGKLVLVRLDDHPAPVGLRDLPAIDATDEQQREGAWQATADATDAAMRSSATQPERRPFNPLAVLAMALLALPGLIALAAAASIWLANRIGPTPGGWPELLHGIDQFGARFGVAQGGAGWVFSAAIALTLIVFGAAVFALWKGVRRSAAAGASRTFVSYASANAPAVLPVIEAAKRGGRSFRTGEPGPDRGWGGNVARAISAAQSVIVMCSKAAFESDHVKREVFLADRYRKRLVPIFIEEAQPPEDFEYFFVGAPSLKLFETPEAERPKALLRILGAVS